ncbi:probable disease resistance protein At4g27220 isoform X2 [Rhodamnia argentea]|uniref:Probable disease resistance protein At4g27220 isoform X2 n=1 Tax=Rhodamnia argentea TaxID=178133 RepID=A0ABM3H2Z9_9MYRT|nr:probable disease resistance protein At4g27220 isoform X2 [Rhodamnia argentea]
MTDPRNAEEGEPDAEVPRGEGGPVTEVPQGEMPSSTDPFLELFEEKPNDKRKRSFCADESPVGDSKRIKVCFAGVRSEALEALKGERALESSNRQGNDEGPSNLAQGSHQPGTASNEDSSRETSIAAMPYLSSGAGSSAFLPLTETNSPNQSLAALTDLPRLKAEEGEPNTELPHGARTHVAPAVSRPGTHRLADTTMTSLKRNLGELISSRLAAMNKLKSKWRRIEEEYWRVARAIEEGISFPPEKVAEVEELSKGIEEICLVLGRFWPEGKALASRSKTYPSATVELLGKEARRKVHEILFYLMEDDVSIIGVYGMGGVGKTAILRHVYNTLHEGLALDVFWVAVPQDFSVYALQEEIASAVGLVNLSNEKDMKRRADLLYGHLNVKNGPVLILDGLWMHFEAKDVGIPVETGNVKLVVTTRSLDVCSMMQCQKQIKIELLDMEDSWELFLKMLCFAGEVPKEVEQIARSLVDRCYGLPLGIIEIASRMKGIEKVHEWRGMLGKLEDSRMELDVFKSLQLSYWKLGDDQVRRCFLHLVLCFGQEEALLAGSRVDLIESFIDEGLLGGSATRQGLHDLGNTILDKIRRACLLDPERNDLYLHPLTRGMALDIVRTTHIVKDHMGLKEIPEEVFWRDCLEKVFLQGNKIEEIPEGISPNCPKLTGLYLSANVVLGFIHETFFRHLKGLTVLDLSETQITELPDSISQLESLEALLLRNCVELRFIPYVGKLGCLRKLDLQGCESLEEAPEGMEMLVNLRYLDLDGTGIETLSEGVLGKLVSLQYLAIKMLRAGEGVKLTEVEALICSVANVETFNACLGTLERNSSRRYSLAVGPPDKHFFCSLDETERYIHIDSCDHIAASADGTSGDGCALLPKSVQSLELSRCHKMKRLMEPEGLTTSLPNLQEIRIYSCEKVEEIICGPLPRGVTCGLTYIGIEACNNMKRVLLTQDMLLHLPFLHEISVSDCKGMEVIIGTVAKMTHCCFPKLRKLALRNLPELKSVCDGTTSCDSLEWISIDNCPKVKRIPLQLPLHDNGLPSPPPSLRQIRINRQTWESLEWDHPLARSSLELVKFLD